ncbi:hypothetical protein HAX54_038645, partial [Datura stramonium]|nr:hypothetical protein [Datura stramonium]
ARGDWEPQHLIDGGNIDAESLTPYIDSWVLECLVDSEENDIELPHSLLITRASCTTRGIHLIYYRRT